MSGTVRIPFRRRSVFTSPFSGLIHAGFTLLLVACGGGEQAPVATTSGPVCDRSAHVLGGITTPSPFVSRGARTVGSEGVLNPEKGADGLYHQGDGVLFGMPTEDSPTSWAVELEPGPSRLLLTWASTSWGDYDLPDAAPLAYVIETSADSTDGSDGAWTEVVRVTGNPVRTRAHAFDFVDQRWVRFTVSAPATMVPVELDEIALYDTSAAAEDTWFFFGDSITAGAFARGAGQLGNFDARVNKERPDFMPAYVGGGIGGEHTKDALDRLDLALELNRDLTYFAVGYGTNDGWGGFSLASTPYEANLTALVERIIAAGHVPVLARIPYASKDHSSLPEFNAVVDRLTKDYGLPCGPDLYGYFKKHPDELMSDGVHPSSFGYQSMNGEWAKAVVPLYPEP